MRFSLKTSSEQPQEYHLNQQPIPFKITQKDLGILVSESSKWSLHINNLISKANKMLGFVRRNCFYLANVNCRRILYLTLVTSQFSRGSEVWAPQGPSSDLLRLESVQRCANDYESSYSEPLQKLNLIPISYWLEIKDTVFYYKCKAGLYDLDIDKYIERPFHRSTRSSTGDFLRPNLCM